MNAIAFTVVLLSCVAFCYGTTQPIIMDTKVEECVDGVCKSVCSFEGATVAEGESFNQPGKCRYLRCSDDGLFSIVITPCPFDITGKYEWVGRDESKLYPECCGEKKLRT